MLLRGPNGQMRNYFKKRGKLNLFLYFKEFVQGIAATLPVFAAVNDS